MPTHGDIIIIHSKHLGTPPFIRCGVPTRLSRTRRKADFRYTDVETGKAVDWFSRSLQFCDWSYAA